MMKNKKTIRICQNCGNVTDNKHETTCTKCGYLTKEKALVQNKTAGKKEVSRDADSLGE